MNEHLVGYVFMLDNVTNDKLSLPAYKASFRFSDDSLGYEYPFTLKVVQKDGFTCAHCPWYRSVSPSQAVSC